MEMGLEANELPNFIIYDTISATPFTCHETTFFHHKPLPITSNSSLTSTAAQLPENHQTNGGGGRRRRKNKNTRVFKNKEEVESQRMTHIAVERNRRKQMNHHLTALRSLLPESYLKRGDQASIVGGAIEFVKELEHHLQSLEAQKFLSTQQQDATIHDQNSNSTPTPTQECEIPQLPLHFHKFFTCPQYTWSNITNKNCSKSKETMADIEVNLVHTHANLRILSRKRLNQLSKMVVFLQTCCLSILHLNVTTFDPLVLYSISLKLEEGCWLNSADEIAGAVHKILGIIEEEAPLCIDSRN